MSAEELSVQAIASAETTSSFGSAVVPGILGSWDDASYKDDDGETASAQQSLASVRAGSRIRRRTGLIDVDNQSLTMTAGTCIIKARIRKEGPRSTPVRGTTPIWKSLSKRNHT